MMPFLRVVRGLTLSCLPLLMTFAAAQNTPVRGDSSDWWSQLRLEELPPGTIVKAQNRAPAESNFQMAGITLSTPRDFSEVRRRFGEAAEVQRGDAASSRNQICYSSASGSVHLIFEGGEIDSGVYLFEGGPHWNGSELCAVSREVTEDMGTASGLRLGIGPDQVMTILGTPSSKTPDRLLYYFNYKGKSTREALAKIRRYNPGISDAEFQQDFQYFDGEACIEARFASGKLNYLSISRSETY